MKERIYISGKITGLPLDIATGYFEKMEVELTKRGYIPVNPMKVLPYKPELTWKDYMVADIDALLRCDGCYMLGNWRDSKGAKLEHEIAKGLGLNIYYDLNSLTCPT